MVTHFPQPSFMHFGIVFPFASQFFFSSFFDILTFDGDGDGDGDDDDDGDDIG
jgi:hypothetical protein